MPSQAVIARQTLNEMYNCLSSSSSEIRRIENTAEELLSLFEDNQTLFNNHSVRDMPGLLVRQTLKLRIIQGIFQNLMETVSHTIQNNFSSSESDSGNNLSPEANFQVFLECINDPGITLRQLRNTLSVVTNDEVDDTNFDDFEQVLFTTVRTLRGL